MRTGGKTSGPHRRSGVLGVLSLLVSSSERGDWRQEGEVELAALESYGPSSLLSRILSGRGWCSASSLLWAQEALSKR